MYMFMSTGALLDLLPLSTLLRVQRSFTSFRVTIALRYIPAAPQGRVTLVLVAVHGTGYATFFSCVGTQVNRPG